MSYRDCSRRSFLMRGTMAGAGIAVGVPILDAFLDNSGKAFAATTGGGRLPMRFGTWFWGCGMIPDRWQPKRTGANYDLPPQLEPIKAVQSHVSILSGFDVALDGAGNLVMNGAESWNGPAIETQDSTSSLLIPGDGLNDYTIEYRAVIPAFGYHYLGLISETGLEFNRGKRRTVPAAMA